MHEPKVSALFALDLYYIARAVTWYTPTVYTLGLTARDMNPGQDWASTLPGEDTCTVPVGGSEYE